MLSELATLKNLSDDRRVNHDLGSEFRITRGALAKIFLYAKLIKEMAGGGTECYGYLMKPECSIDDLVTDAYLADSQTASPAYVSVSPEGVYRSGQRAAELGYEIIGWWHSHGTMPPFHSGTDVRNFINVLSAIAPNTTYRYENVIHAAERDSIAFDNYVMRDVRPGQHMRVLKRVERAPFAYSLVVNVMGKHYLEHIFKEYDTANSKYILSQPTHPALRVVDAENDIHFSFADIEKDIRAKVTIHGEMYGGKKPVTDNGSQYHEIAGRFYDMALGVIAAGGAGGPFLRQVINAGSDIMHYSLLLEAGQIESHDDGQVLSPREDFIANISEGYHMIPINRLKEGRAKLETYELRNKIFLNFMAELGLHTGNLDPQGTIGKYQSEAKSLEQDFRLADDAAWAICEYAMGDLTDYKKELSHKHRVLMSRLATQISGMDNVPMAQALDRAKGFSLFDRQRGLFLLPERAQALNQILLDLYKDRTGERKLKSDLLGFIAEFPKAYEQNPGSVDKIIERYLLSGG